MLSASGGSALPFTVGQALRQGHVPSGSALLADIANFQFVVKNRWPDGSAKFALLSGQVDASANQWRTIGLSVGTAAASTSTLGTADLKATGVAASIQFGSFGAASWSGTDWDSPVQSWVSGPQMSSWVYRKPLGSDAHLVAWLEVRAYRGGRVEVLPWIENGFLKVANPTTKTGTATFSLGGTQRFSQSLNLFNHRRAVLASGTTLTHWFGGDPQITPQASSAYLMSTKTVPNYRAVTPSSSALYGRLAGSYTPLDQTNFPTEMGTPGYHASIGLLPEWDVAYLSTGGDVRALRAVVINAYAAGRYGIHYRDESTNRPLRFSSYPNLVMSAGSGVSDTGGSTTSSYTPTPSGDSGPTFKVSHHPSMGYMAYLLTGWNYFLEESQLLATSNFLKQSDNTRGYTNGAFESSAGTNTVRGAAWAIRSLAMATSITPDTDPLRSEFVASVDAQINYYHGRYIAIKGNTQGFVDIYADLDPGDPLNHQIWMDDFFTASFGFLNEQQVNSSSTATKLNQFLAWKFGAIVGRLGGSGADQFSYRYAAQYSLNYSPSAGARWSDGSGPWYASWGELARSMNIPTTGNLGEPLESAYPAEATSYWGNLMPAISYAVDFGATGAAEGWNRIVSASNFPTQASAYNNDPVWGVQPRSR